MTRVFNANRRADSLDCERGRNGSIVCCLRPDETVNKTGDKLLVGLCLVIQRLLPPQLVQITLQLPSAIPILDPGLDPTFPVNPRLQPSELPNKRQVLRLQPQHRAKIVASITNVNDPLESVPSTISLQEGLEFCALAHVRRAADRASVLLLCGSQDATFQDERAIVVEASGVGDDLIKESGEVVVVENGVDVNGVAVGEEEEGGLTGGFEVAYTAFYSGVEGKRLQCGADVRGGLAGSVKFDEQVCAEIGELLFGLSTLEFSSEGRAEHFVDVSICVLVHQRPIEIKHDQLLALDQR